jgi:hypothetical protein
LRITALTKPAPEETKEVLAVMNINMTVGQLADLGMPVSGRGRIASVRALPMTGSAVATGPKSAFVDATPVCGYSHITDVAVLMGTFPGTSAWSPPN